MEGFIRCSPLNDFRCLYCGEYTFDPVLHKEQCISHVKAERDILSEEVERLRKMCAEAANFIERLAAAGGADAKKSGLWQRIKEAAGKEG